MSRYVFAAVLVSGSALYVGGNGYTPLLLSTGLFLCGVALALVHEVTHD